MDMPERARQWSYAFPISRCWILLKTFFTRQCKIYIQLRYLRIVHSLVYRDVAKWTVIEATLGIVAGCLPTIWPLLTAMRSRCVSSKLDYVNDKPLQHGGRVERGTKQDTIQNNHDTTQNNRDTILIHTDFFLSESFVNNSDNHVRHDPNNSFRHDQWRP